MWQPAPRSAETSIPCPQCREPMLAKRTCHMAYLHCPHCRKDFKVQDHIREMDEALENFLEAINCDRV